MRRIGRFMRLSASDRRLLVRAAFWLWAIRLGLWLLPFQVLRRLRDGFRGAGASPDYMNQLAVERLSIAVTRASKYVPKASCLTQALALQGILAREGRASRLIVGVAKGESGELESHAWVESQGQIIIGRIKDKDYTPILVLKGENS